MKKDGFQYSESHRYAQSIAHCASGSRSARIARSETNQIITLDALGRARTVWHFGPQTANFNDVLPFKKVLFPVDYSEPCLAIVPYVKEMQRHFSAQLSLVHAYGPEALAFSPLPMSDPQLPEEAKALAEERLREFAQSHFPGSHVELFTGVGEPGGVISDLVQHQGADLVMLATHGRGPLRRFLLGSVTTKVLHDLTVPVWTGHPLRVPYRSILAAVDGSEEAETVVRAAHAFAVSYQAQLSLAYVLEMPPVAMETAFGPYRDDFVEAADIRLRELKGQLGIDAPHAIVDGPIADALREEALRTDADLIVTGRGRTQGAFSRIWSHLYPIVRHAPCPVLSI
jgi:nucleotide-binding universal stress UspA family protein